MLVSIQPLMLMPSGDLFVFIEMKRCWVLVALAKTTPPTENLSRWLDTLKKKMVKNIYCPIVCIRYIKAEPLEYTAV